MKAYDYEDGDLTVEVIVKESNVDTTKAGQYTITYEVVDRRGYVITKTINVTVEYYREDFNKDRVIDELDLGILSQHYNKTNKDIDFDATYDLNDDGIIDIYDQVILSKLM